MRYWIALLALGALLAAPGRAPAGGPDDEPDEGSSTEEHLREQVEALHELEQAETDDEADAAMKRFDDAAERELDERRQRIDGLIER